MIDNQKQNAYSPLFQDTYLPDEQYEAFNLALPDEKLNNLLIKSLDENVSFWDQAPWKLRQTDQENVKYLLGDQLSAEKFLNDDARYIDNRLFAATRAILSYATGQLAVPEVSPSKSDDAVVHMARSIQAALYQHAADEQVDQKTRAAVMNLLTRKRGFLKLRFDPDKGLYGDIVTEVCNPEDIIIDRYAGFMENPNVIYHRLRCSVDELVARFPKKRADIMTAYAIKQERFTQLSKFVTYFEAWFSYRDAQGRPAEGVCWFIPEHSLILDKMPNPNWVYTGDPQRDKATNVLFVPPKPFVNFNYLNMGHSYIDETCLFDQAKPQQEMLNKRGRQIWENADYANGRWIANSKAMSEESAAKMVNKGAKTIGLVNAEDVTKAFANVASQALPSYVYNTLLDARQEIDTMMGTPAVFRGEAPNRADTLGRDMLIKQQAGMLQDDLVRSVALGMEKYYSILLQMMRVNYTDDYWFQTKGGDGKFDFIMLNGDNIDTNVKIGVQVDSTLPLDKAAIRATAMELAKKSPVGIDMLTLMQDLGLPNPEIRTERYLRSQLDPAGFMQSVEQQIDDNDAEIDILLLIGNREPAERDEYGADYINYFNDFMTKNRFAKLPQDAKQRIVTYLMAVQHLAMQSAQLQSNMLDEAGMSTVPPAPPEPKKTVQIRLDGKIDPAQSNQIAGGNMAPPANAAAAATNPNTASSTTQMPQAIG